MTGFAVAAVLAGALGGAAEGECLPDGSGFLAARLGGELQADIDWRQPGLACTGMQRPDGQGMRLRFSSTLDDGSRLSFVFAPPVLAEGENAVAVPVNVTVLQESAGRIYGTRGKERCLLDEVRQSPLPAPASGGRAWAVEARGFCVEPARSLDGVGAVLLMRFDFRGRVDFREEPRRPAPALDAPPP